MIPLLPRNEIEQYEDLIALLAKDLDPRAAAIANDDFSGAALRNSLLFSQASALKFTALSRLTNAELFYNRYYWFFLFTKLHQIRHGPDAGLEQQAYKLLEAAPGDVDWNIVQEIDDRVEHEIQNCNGT